ncbi:hypothetical protein SAMN05216221_1385 [Pseudomonas oryzae]|uniref:Uncharacterized protein n=1 Tax=Pseudomonas oryzae TaxID=1392877 RepID=A0A1H1QM49_9PSED|nr:hypothetical protein SAMN05216221_1385 [Pseudomonas oryzae]
MVSLIVISRRWNNISVRVQRYMALSGRINAANKTHPMRA